VRHGSQRLRASTDPIDILDQLIRRPSLRGGPSTHSELEGMRRFQRWLAESGRVSDSGGSPWWCHVNGSVLGDLMAADGTGAHSYREGSSSLIVGWETYLRLEHRHDRTAACWSAHQNSLLSAAARAEDLLKAEPDTEQQFIRAALAAVTMAADANLPTGRAGAVLIGGFCRAFYPSTYPANVSAGPRALKALDQTAQKPRRGLRLGVMVLRELAGASWRNRRAARSAGGS
jgi:hypothetical protein